MALRLLGLGILFYELLVPDFLFLIGLRKVKNLISMATIKNFEDLEIWKDARILAKNIYKLTHKTDFAKDFSLKDQIRRSSSSVMDNVAEGFDRDGTKEFIHFLTISKGSLSETKSQLYRAMDLQYITQEEFNDCYVLANKIGKMIGGFIKYLRQSDYKGNKFKEEKVEYKINPKSNN